VPVRTFVEAQWLATAIGTLLGGLIACPTAAVSWEFFIDVVKEVKVTSFYYEFLVIICKI